MLYTSMLQETLGGVVNYSSVFASLFCRALPYQSIGINQIINFKNKYYVFRQSGFCFLDGETIGQT